MKLPSVCKITNCLKLLSVKFLWDCKLIISFCFIFYMLFYFNSAQSRMCLRDEMLIVTVIQV